MCINSLRKVKVGDGLGVISWSDVPRGVYMAKEILCLQKRKSDKREGMSEGND